MKNQSLIAAILMLVTFVAYGQQPQRPSDDELNARIQALSAQRNEALDKYAVLAGMAEAQVRKLQGEIDVLKKAADSLPIERVSPAKDAKVLTVPDGNVVCFADGSQCFKRKAGEKK